MKKDILTQRFNYGVITTFKDYSNLSDKPAPLKPMGNFGPICGSTITEIDDDFRMILSNEFGSHPFKTDNEKISESLFLHGKKFGKKRNTKYFYNYEEVETKAPLYSLQTIGHFTTNDRQIKRHYGNPFSNITLKLIERSIRVDGDKICVRAYTHIKSRSINCKFFKRRKQSIGFTFNLKTGNFISYDTTTNGSTFRQNSFNHLKTVISNIFDTSQLSYLFSNKKMDSLARTEEKLKKELDDTEFAKHFFHLIGKDIKKREDFLYENVTTKHGHVNQFIEWMMALFLEINKIKAPNNYNNLLMEWYPTKPFLKRNENKLIVSILDRLGLKTKSMIKLMHKEEFNIKKVLVLAKYFGYKDVSKYLSNVHPNFFDAFVGDSTINGYETPYHFFRTQYEYDLTSREKSNFLKILNRILENGDAKDLGESLNRVLLNQFRQFDDHFNMISKIRKYIPETEMRATNEIDFHNEHLELSKIERTIRKGYSIQYNFQKRLVDTIEKEIIGHVSDEEYLTTSVYYPVILKTDSEYSEEGSHMHHCVASYVDSENSLIISIRENNPAGNERVTCEYNVRTKELIQARSFCNAVPPERFEPILKELTKRIETFKGSIKSTGKEKIPLFINGIEITAPQKNEFEDLMDRLAIF